MKKKSMLSYFLVVAILVVLIIYKIKVPSSFIISAFLYTYCFVSVYFLFIFRKYRYLDLAVRWMIVCAVLVGAFTLSVLLKDISTNKNNMSKNDYVIVLGAGITPNGNPKTVLRYRLDKALEYYKENPDTIFIVSGGKGKDEIISESKAMKNYLVNKGVPKYRVIEENKSTSTLENLKFSKELIPEGSTVGVISNDFHLYRVKFLSSEIGLSLTPIYAKTPPKNRYSYFIREVIAILAYKIFFIRKEI